MSEQPTTTISDNDRGKLSPGFLVGSCWLILLLICGLFGYDIHMWAFSSDSKFMEERVLPVTEQLSKFSNDSGLRQLRIDVEAKVHPLYDDSRIVAEIPEPE
jgi:hypothetical protein